MKSLDPRKKAISSLDRAFSKMIRERDKDLPCIACNRFHRTYEAGHFRPRGMMPTRWDPINVNKEGYGCNRTHVTKYGIKDMELYRENLDKRWGKGTATMLYKISQSMRQFSIEEMQQLTHAAKLGYPAYQQLYSELKLKDY